EAGPGRAGRRAAAGRLRLREHRARRRPHRRAVRHRHRLRRRVADRDVQHARPPVRGGEPGPDRTVQLRAQLRAGREHRAGRAGGRVRLRERRQHAVGRRGRRRGRPADVRPQRARDRGPAGRPGPGDRPGRPGPARGEGRALPGAGAVRGAGPDRPGPGGPGGHPGDLRRRREGRAHRRPAGRGGRRPGLRHRRAGRRRRGPRRRDPGRGERVHGVPDRDPHRLAQPGRRGGVRRVRPLGRGHPGADRSRLRRSV
ncbi:MAG: Molybdenum ABC transporter, substrate-binding protein ModA, partial [uncultured Corynebacteriales bacterium]